MSHLLNPTAADARAIVFAEVPFNGLPALFSELRLDEATVPEGLHVYEMRYAENDPFQPIEVARHVHENFYGTLITTRRLSLLKAGHITLPISFAFDFRHAAVTTLSESSAVGHVREIKARERGAR
jgi:hypothetical protein